MSRQARVGSATGYYHIMMRGNNKTEILKEDDDKALFHKSLFQLHEEGLLELVAWCLMDNHVHMVVKAELLELSLAMKRLNIKYAMYYHRVHGTSGHVFQDRYKSQPIESDQYLMAVIRYVHMNPVKANFVKSPATYKWSSYKAYLDDDGVVEMPQIKFVWSYFNQNKKRFKTFHAEEDLREFLEIKEDKERIRLERAEKIIDRYMKAYKLTAAKDIYKDTETLINMIQEVRDVSKLSLRKIAKLIELPSSTVQTMLLRSKRLA